MKSVTGQSRKATPGPAAHPCALENLWVSEVSSSPILEESGDASSMWIEAHLKEADSITRLPLSGATYGRHFVSQADIVNKWLVLDERARIWAYIRR